MPDSFDDWMQRRQDVRTWTEDELRRFEEAVTPFEDIDGDLWR